MYEPDCIQEYALMCRRLAVECRGLAADAPELDLSARFLHMASSGRSSRFGTVCCIDEGHASGLKLTLRHWKPSMTRERDERMWNLAYRLAQSGEHQNYQAIEWELQAFGYPRASQFLYPEGVRKKINGICAQARTMFVDRSSSVKAVSRGP